jgi:hypothetical protein
MFGLEILDVVIGLTFVYLLLALFATALNEYIAAVLNLRGKELAKGLGQLLDDLDEKDALNRARDGVGTKLTTTAQSLTEQLYNHRLIRPFATRQGLATRFVRWVLRRKSAPVPRLPSYIPARTFALALLDLLGVDGKDASLDNLIAGKATGQAAADTEAAPAAGTTPAPAVAKAEQALATAQTAAEAAAAADKPSAEKALAAARLNVTKAKLAQVVADAEAALAAAHAAHTARPTDATETALKSARQALARVKLAQVLAILKQESSLDLTEHLATLGGLSTAGNKLAADLQLQVAGALADAQTQLQKLHDGVEVWFNNAMDRVSGAYKRTAQGWLFVLGLLIASCMNADTIDMWRRLEADDELRSAMVRRAEAAVAPMDSIVADSAAAARTDTAPATSPLTASPPAPAPPADSVTTQVPTGDSIARLARATDSPAVTLTSATGSATQGMRDTTSSDSAKLAAVKRARANYQATRARLDSMELKLGWTTKQGVEARLLRVDAKNYPRKDLWRWPITKLERAFTPKGYHADLFPLDTGPSWVKLIGLLLTALAISLGAPFWFDLLNKVISIRAAGRSPEERPKSPEGGPKRTAERAPK